MLVSNRISHLPVRSNLASMMLAGVIGFGLVANNSSSVQAQTRDAQLWTSWIVDWDTPSSFLLELELDYNLLLSAGPQWYEYAIQPAIEYYPSNSIDLFAAVYFTTTRQNDDDQTDEIRPIIGLRWNIIKPEKRVYLRSQLKYEYRFFSDRSGDDIINSGRIRIRLDLMVPITQKSYNVDDNLYGKIWTEIFLNNDERINERYQSTFRQYLGLGYRFSYSWRLEADYVLQATRDTKIDDGADNISHVIFTTLKYFIP